jgi:Bacterial Ig-like domain
MDLTLSDQIRVRHFLTAVLTTLALTACPQDTIPPVLIGTVPQNGAVNVDIENSILLKFSEVINLDSVNNTTVALTDANGEMISLDFIRPFFLGDFQNLYFRIQSAPKTETVKLKLSSGLTDRSGNPLVASEISFKLPQWWSPTGTEPLNQDTAQSVELPVLRPGYQIEPGNITHELLRVQWTEKSGGTSQVINTSIRIDNGSRTAPEVTSSASSVLVDPEGMFKVVTLNGSNRSSIKLQGTTELLANPDSTVIVAGPQMVTEIIEEPQMVLGPSKKIVAWLERPAASLSPVTVQIREINQEGTTVLSLPGWIVADTSQLSLTTFGQTTMPVIATQIVTLDGIKLIARQLVRPNWRDLPDPNVITGLFTLTKGDLEDLGTVNKLYGAWLNGLGVHTWRLRNGTWQEMGNGTPLNVSASEQASNLQLDVATFLKPVLTWTESNAANTSSKLYLKRWNGSGWELLGGGPVASNVSIRDVSLVRFQGSIPERPFVAWVERATNDLTVGGKLFVRRWNR